MFKNLTLPSLCISTQLYSYSGPVGEYIEKVSNIYVSKTEEIKVGVINGH